ncbi:hemerythrin domain-containing protein [Burkholderia multivorans]|uniref:hemerythrin domain-containing protein n=1 Tax=Burkholderia multivorans TaxID=87883 RepID=UPI002158F41E|nr:hemerythrin domain-containing protein [Burkholderia multivorans]
MAEPIFDALRESHEIRRPLMRRLLRSQPGEARSALFEQLRIELSAHEAAEERFLYVPMLMDDRGLHPSRDALADHHLMDEIARSSETRGKIFFQNSGRFCGRLKRRHSRSTTGTTTVACMRRSLTHSGRAASSWRGMNDNPVH